MFTPYFRELSARKHRATPSAKLQKQRPSEAGTMPASHNKMGGSPALPHGDTGDPLESSTEDKNSVSESTPVKNPDATRGEAKPSKQGLMTKFMNSVRPKNKSADDGRQKRNVWMTSPEAGTEGNEKKRLDMEAPALPK